MNFEPESICKSLIKFFAFVELKTIELTTACLDLDGIVYHGAVLKVHRANEYKPELVQYAESRELLKLNLSTPAFLQLAKGTVTAGTGAVQSQSTGTVAEMNTHQSGLLRSLIILGILS